jgi:WHG domain-containing protein
MPAGLRSPVVLPLAPRLPARPPAAGKPGTRPGPRCHRWPAVGHRCGRILRCKCRARRPYQTFADLTAVAATAAGGISDPGEAPLARCRAYCHFALEHPVHYQVMFHLDLAPSLAANPGNTPGRRAFQVLVRAVQACQTAGAATATGDPFRLASLVWAAEHGLVSLRLSRPQFPWSDLDGLVDEAVTKIMGLQRKPAQ